MKKIFFIVMCLIMIKGLNAQSFSFNNSEIMAQRRITEINKIISLDSEQKTNLAQKCLEYQLKIDSALYFENDPMLYTKKYDQESEEFNKYFYSILTDKQISNYVRIKNSVEVKRKSDERIKILKETGEYDDVQLNKMNSEIYNYLMLEKVVYARDKYDISKQKENIFRLKILQPSCLAEADTRRKLKHKGQLKTGKVKWNK